MKSEPGLGEWNVEGKMDGKDLISKMSGSFNSMEA